MLPQARFTDAGARYLPTLTLVRHDL